MSWHHLLIHLIFNSTFVQHEACSSRSLILRNPRVVALASTVEQCCHRGVVALASTAVTEESSPHQRYWAVLSPRSSLLAALLSIAVTEESSPSPALLSTAVTEESSPRQRCWTVLSPRSRLLAALLSIAVTQESSLRRAAEHCCHRGVVPSPALLNSAVTEESSPRRAVEHCCQRGVVALASTGQAWAYLSFLQANYILSELIFQWIHAATKANLHRCPKLHK